ncbi:hypothetical protein Golax_019067 [Gossypium laxum]|uniref:Protein kinase domain-containing protein n=1 Tax=Gossypium laxum TaxID=34288 RepID=A0A7J8Z5G5_9ROSI|nr:hypothetical protein [Gossypium laxum]
MLLVLVLTISRIYRGLWPKELIKQREKFFLQNGGIILQQQLSKFNEAVSVKIHTSEELSKATNNFNESNTVGQGDHGTVYKGILCDNRVVAIKKSMIADHSQVEQFTNEVIVLSQVNHRNVVKLFRCLETEVPLLVYKFIANGTLYEHLQSSGLGQECRLRITAETARALSYSNSAAYPPIIHRDVNQLTEKSDVYSFRVVLAELLTGRKALCFQVPEEERNLAMHYVFTLKKDQLFRIIDHHVLVEGNTTQIQVAMLANRCLRVKGKERPSMKEVATVLEGLRAMLSICPVSPQESSEGSSSDYGSC